MPRSKDGRWTRQCQVCGKDFQAARVGTITCSVACRAKLPHNTGGPRVAANLERRTCPTCGKEYQPYRAIQLACSRDCYRQMAHVVERERQNNRRPERKARKNELRRGSDRVRAYNRKKQLERYGITVEQHDEMLAAQGGLCAICGNPPDPDGVRATSRLHTDHDHITGRVRALLCNNCNRGVGCFADDPARLRAAAEYIEKHRRLAPP